MPRADRNKKTAMKALAEAAAHPGQSPITSSYAKTSSEEITNEITAHEKLEEGTSVSETQVSEDCDIALYETWVNAAADYTSQDKKDSEKTEDSFLENGSQSTVGLLITEKRKMHFAQHAPLTVKRRRELSILNTERDLIIGRKVQGR